MIEGVNDGRYSYSTQSYLMSSYPLHIFKLWSRPRLASLP